MKKILAILLALTLVCMGCVGLADAADTTTAVEDKPLIGILAPAATHGWVARRQLQRRG